MESRNSRRMHILFLLFYVFSVIWFTVLKRSTIDYHSVRIVFFWSYQKWLTGNKWFGKEIMANIAMFIPLGFLLTGLLENRKLLKVLLVAFLLSITIELLQFTLMRGLFECDDLISNTAGAVIGNRIYVIAEKLIWNKKHFQILTTFVGITVTLVCLGLYIREQTAGGEETSMASREYCFQVDEASLDDNLLILKGFVFRYKRPDDMYDLILHSTDTGEEIALAVTAGIARSDVNGYFLCEKDYMNTGFIASGEVSVGEEYEIMIKWPWSTKNSTGVYVTDGRIHYAKEENFSEPDLTDPFVAEGILRVYRPDYHCWVYQYNGALYWIVDEGFDFEEDGTTRIQYQLWTTQTENLPEKRLANNNLWDNIGDYFEKNEIQGEFGSYRVMRRELPTAYSITSIVTGYYKNGKWIWKNCFRPLYQNGSIY